MIKIVAYVYSNSSVRRKTVSLKGIFSYCFFFFFFCWYVKLCPNFYSKKKKYFLFCDNWHSTQMKTLLKKKLKLYNGATYFKYPKSNVEDSV